MRTSQCCSPCRVVFIQLVDGNCLPLTFCRIIALREKTDKVIFLIAGEDWTVPDSYEQNSDTKVSMNLDLQSLSAVVP